MRKSLLTVAAISAILVIAGTTCARRQAPHWTGKKVVVLGFDGLDPILCEKWMDEGKLPNLAKLRADGYYSRLETVNPAQSPVAWSAFATGSNPGKTRIFDFLRRDPETYYPDFSTVTIEKPSYIFKLLPTRRPKVTSNRKGISVWKLTTDAGVPTMVIQAPVCFPPEEIPGGELLSGLGVPDIRGTMGTFSYYASDEKNDQDLEMGGKVIPIEVSGSEVRTFVVGPRNPFASSEPGKKDVTIPLDIKVNRDARSMTINLQGRSETIKVGKWSGWFEPVFSITPIVKVHGLCRFHCLQVEPNVRLYLSPINLHPARPPMPVSYPKEFSGKLVKEVGLFKTLGWPEDTWAINEERIDEKTFLEDVYFTFDALEKITFNELKNFKEGFFISVFQGTDRIQHLFWRFLDKRHPMYDAKLAGEYGDEILKVFQRADKIVGRAMDSLGDNGELVVLSDHGFHSWRRSVNINTWFVRNGFMKLSSTDSLRDRNLEDLFGHGSFWPNVDWNETRAYALALGQIYINVAGREKHGIVTPGPEYDAVRDDIIKKFTALTDSETGESVVRRVYKREEIYSGEYFNEAPDLVVGFNDGYRVSWQTCLGGIPKDILEDNKKKWSADHCSLDPEITKGVLFASTRGLRESPRIIDVAPTILAWLGVKAPQSMDGRTLLSGR